MKISGGGGGGGEPGGGGLMEGGGAPGEGRRGVVGNSEVERGNSRVGDGWGNNGGGVIMREGSVFNF